MDGKIISKIIKFEIKSFQMFQKRDETPQSSSQPHQQFNNSSELHHSSTTGTLARCSRGTGARLFLSTKPGLVERGPQVFTFYPS